MPNLFTGHDEDVRNWVSGQLGLPQIGGNMFATLGIEHDGKLVGGAVYHNYHGHMIEMSIATISPKWCSRKILKGLLYYPFIDVGVIRVNAVVAKNNKPMRNFLPRIGFKQEGCARKAYDGSNDAVLYGMLKNECKWNLENG